MKIRTYSELSRLKTFDERFEYLQLKGTVGQETFGFDRIFNQMFYKGPVWRPIRRDIILRDKACDLGLEGYEIREKVLIHHMNPISLEDIESHSDWLTNPEYLISTTFSTHNAITYGNRGLLIRHPVERSPYDTSPWRR